ncbi:MAG: hypothetical protein FJ308_16785 [Planctomycetes bacterium]|nr:hypothetical protein [Planctomycetota bacterium]
MSTSEHGGPISEPIESWIDRYLDSGLSQNELECGGAQLVADPQFADRVVRACVFDILLEEHFAVVAAESSFSQVGRSQVLDDGAIAKTHRDPRSRMRRWSMVAALAASVLVMLFWFLPSRGAANAVAKELQRISQRTANAPDREFAIRVASQGTSRRKGRYPVLAEDTRPPKPSLDGAKLFVRGGRQFVLMRQMETEEWFITGSDRVSSWAIRPGSPVRVSDDLSRFDRDLPGHEHAVPLWNIDEDSSILLDAYYLSVEPASETMMKLIAVKRSKQSRGPFRFEIDYRADTGDIEYLRFYDMPYGPDHIPLLEMELVDSELHAPEFFSHQFHHEADRLVERE